MALTESFQKLKKGERAPDFLLKGVDGREYSLKDFEVFAERSSSHDRAKHRARDEQSSATASAEASAKEGLLVIFMCNHCPYVKAKIGTIVRLYEKWGGRVSFAGINSNDPEYEDEGMENMKIFSKERNISFPYLLDETQETAKAYGATCTPDPFLFDKDFKLAFHGRIDDALGPGQEAKKHTIDENISKMLSGEEIADEFKPSMGCSIKWKGRN